ncbi:MAG: inositol monophosphatase [Candidatus Marinimicrobia bacterium]|nr:inositol monophosphatase [Candidatus Neomarinimicrobiota bacterium]
MINTIFQTANYAIEKATQIVLEAHNLPKVTEFKGKTDLVTKTDRQSEEIIISEIQNAFPTHGIIAEESERINAESEYQWIIDPLDGTTNFVHGYPSFGISIGILHNNEIICGIVKELPVNKTYSAIKGKSAFCNGKQIRVSDVDSLGESLLVTGFGYEHSEKWSANMKLFKQFTDITQGVRRLGAAAVDLCHVACGIVDGFWEFDLQPWDTAAGVLIVKEAGGTITKMDESKYSINHPQLLATNCKLHVEMITITRPIIEELINKGIKL